MAKSALPTCNLRNALPTCSQKPNQIGSMQSKPKRSTSREDATRIPHVPLCHRLLAGGFCGVVAPAATFVFARAACGRFCAVVRAGAQRACAGALLASSAFLSRWLLRRRGARRGTRCCPRSLGPLRRCRSRRRCRLPRSFPKRLHVSTGYAALALPRGCPAGRRRRPASNAARRLLSAGRCAGRQRHALCAGGTAARPLCARAPAFGCRGGRRNWLRR